MNYFRIQFSLALLVSIILVSFQTFYYPSDLSVGDSYAYMSVAKDIVDTGIFTDGRFKDNAYIEGENGQGMFFAPLYPLLIAGTMMLDSVFYDTVSCHLTSHNIEKCSDYMGIFRFIQVALASLSVFLIWFSGWFLSKKYVIAWLAMGIALLAESYAYYTAQVMTENLVFPLFTMVCLSFASAFKQKQMWLWFVSGLLLGLLALTRPSFVYLFYASIPIIFIIGIYQRELSLKHKISLPFLLIVGYLLTAGPWIIRNGINLGEYAISKGYASYILVQRISYNDMSWKEWGVSFVYGLPDFGDSLARRMFEPKNYERFDYQNPEGFYRIGNNELRKDTLEKAGGIENHLSYLIKNNIIGNIYKHVMVTLSLAWRGMWVSKYWGLISIPIFIGVFIWALRKEWWEFIIFSVSPWFMLGFHAFTSVNVVRYNLILIPCLAIAMALITYNMALFLLKCFNKKINYIQETSK